MEERKEVKVSTLLSYLDIKIAAIMALVEVVIVICTFLVLDSKLKAVIISCSIIISVMLIVRYVSSQISKTRDGVVLEYERQVFSVKVKKAWLLDQYSRVCELMKFSDERLRLLAEARLQIKSILDLENVQIELSMPKKNYTGQELREALQREKKQVEAQMAELALPEKPRQYLWWEKRFKLDTVQAA